MNVQFDQRLISSFILFLDHVVQKEGGAFTNYSGQFYPVTSKYQGLYAYASPFKQLCNDNLITGANVITGCYLNGNFVGLGQSGLSKINHKDGILYFTGQLPANTVVSGRYAIKDFNIELTDQPEYKLLFETKYVTNSKFNQILSGLDPDIKTSPAIFVKVKSLENKPFAFTRIDDNNIKFRAVVVADNEFQKIGVCNVLKNFNYREFKVASGTPFDHLGNFTGLNYNYTGLTFLDGYWPLIMEAKVIDIPLVGQFANLPRNVAAVDFTVSTVMVHP